MSIYMYIQFAINKNLDFDNKFQNNDIKKHALNIY